MRTVFSFLMAVIFLALSGQASAQLPAPPETPGTGAVTVLTDGIAEPSGRISRGFSALSQHLDEAGKLRVLPLMGYGGTANVRDLLKLKGADFAILNSDILAYLAYTKGYPDAPRRIRYVTALYEEKVYLIVRNKIQSVQELKGLKVITGPENSASFITAYTIFSGLKLAPKLTPAKLTPGTALPKDADAFLLLERDVARIPNTYWRSGEYHLLNLAAAGELAKIYRPASFEEKEAPDLQPRGAVQTLKVETLLAVYDWAPSSARYADAARFIDTLLTSMPALRQKLPDTFWPETNLKTSAPGWHRYALAEARLKTLPAASLAALRTRQIPSALPAQPPAAQSAAPGQPSSPAQPEEAGTKPAPSAPVRLSAIARPPLTESKKPNGGFIADLTVSAMRASGYIGAEEFSIHWAENGARQLDELLTKNATDIALPWVAPDCENPENLGPSSALICDGALMSAPLFQAVYTFYVRADGDFRFENDDSIAQRVVCVPEHHDLTDLNGPDRRWVSEGKVKVLRPATLIDCFGMVERHEADAVLVNELEGHFVVDRLGLAQVLRPTERAVANHAVVALAAKTNPRGEAMLAAISGGIAKLKQGEQYAQIVEKTLAELWQRNKAAPQP
jgi:hypothetical protein